MKNLIVISAIAIALFSNACSTTKTGSTAQTYNVDTTKVKSGEVYYQCPMHPEVISNKAGQCPKCGMALEKRTKM